MARSHVELFEQIRRDWRAGGSSIRELAVRHHVHRRTVRQALAAAQRGDRDRHAGVHERLVPGLGAQRALGATFACSSLLTPFFMSTVIGAIATGQVPASASHASCRPGRARRRC
jgi:hypothetical protein